MKSLLSRSLILAASRVMNFGIQLLSPLILVRIFDVTEFGQYQEFMLYATFLTAFFTFSLDSSVSYFIARYPGRDKDVITQSTQLMLATSMASLLLIIIFSNILQAATSYDFVLPLALYTLFFSSFNWLEFYWITKRKAESVFIYTFCRLFARMAVLITVATVTENVIKTIWALVIFEGMRVLMILLILLIKGGFSKTIDKALIIEQLRYAIPTGVANIIQTAGANIGKFYVSAVLGAPALAYYAAGSYLQPLARVIRSGVSDTVYPELVEMSGSPKTTFALWRRVNVLLCALLFPAFAICSLLADKIVIALFGQSYSPAAAVFAFYSLVLIRRSFSIDIILRITGQTNFMMFGALWLVALNLILIFPLTNALGLVGPAIAYVLSEFFLEAYYTRVALKKYGLSLSVLIDTTKLISIIFCCVVTSPLLLFVKLSPETGLPVVIFVSLIYFAISNYCAFLCGVDDIGKVSATLWKRAIFLMRTVP